MSYTPPAIGDIDFVTRSYTPPTVDAVDFIMGGSGGSSTSIIIIHLEQIYGIGADFLVVCHQPYAYNLEIFLAQRYGDVATLQKVCDQYYGDAAILQRSLLQRWGDALELAAHLEQAWSLVPILEISCLQPWGISAGELQKSLEQLYGIDAAAVISAVLSQPYALQPSPTDPPPTTSDGWSTVSASGGAAIYPLTTALYIDSVRIPYHALEWQATESEYGWYCAFSTVDRAAAMLCIAGAAVRIDHMGESYHLKIYEGWLCDRRHAEEIYRVEAWSKCRDLDQAAPLTGDIAGGMASAVIAALAAPYSITTSYQMVDGFIGEGRIVANAQTPLAIIADIVHDIGGILQADLDGNLLIVAAEEISVPAWDTTTPAMVLNAQVDRITSAEQADEQKGYNRFIISDAIASASETNTPSLEYIELTATSREVRLFAVPFSGRSFTLRHSGGTVVSIEPMGQASLTIDDEIVEFIDGLGKTTKPIASITATDWLQDDLGAITNSEDGQLTAAILGYSLLKTSYTANFIKWNVSSSEIDNVQFIAEETL